MATEPGSFGSRADEAENRNLRAQVRHNLLSMFLEWLFTLLEYTGSENCLRGWALSKSVS